MAVCPNPQHPHFGGDFWSQCSPAQCALSVEHCRRVAQVADSLPLPFAVV